jgi:hypothetical protein
MTRLRPLIGGVFYFMETQEIWRDVIGYEGLYQVSNLGRVKALSKLRKVKRKKCEYSFLAPEIILSAACDKGYMKVALTKNKIRSTKKIHRLVASAFLGDNPDLYVNHIDCNRSNNNLNNLEWVTHLENIRHARLNNRYPKLKMSDNHKKILKDKNAKKVICIKTNKIYNSIVDAANELGYKKSTLIHYLLGSRTNKTTLRYL